MSDTTRRRFLGLGAAGGTALLISWIRPLSKLVFADVRTFKGATYLTPAYRAVKGGILGFVDMLKREAKDVVRIEFFDSGTLMKADAQIAGLKDGLVQFIFHTTSYMTKTFPILGITGLPGVCDLLYEHPERLAIKSPLWKLINSELARDNLFLLSTGGGVVEPEYIWSGKKRILSLADLKGTRCRVVSREGVEVLKRFGVSGVRVPSAQAYLALQRGQVDAVVANISTIIARNLHEQLQFCYQLPVTAFSVSVFLLKSTWDRMSEREKAAFWSAAQWYDEHQSKTANTQVYPQEYWPAVQKAGIRVVRPSSDDLEIFAREAKFVWQWWKTQVGEAVGQQAIDLARGA